MSTLKFEMYGAPETIVSDSGPNFKSEFFRARNPFERVEFDEWAEGLDDFEQFTF